MGKIRNTKQYIVPGALISASYVSDLYDLVTGNLYEDTAFSGSVSVTGSIYGNLIGTASNATTASYAISSSISDKSIYAISSSYAPNTGVTKIIAGNNVIISPSNGIGEVTITAKTCNGGGGGGGGTTGDFSVNSGSANFMSVPDTLNVGGGMFFDLADLPTVDPNNAGQVWRSGNFLMISLG